MLAPLLTAPSRLVEGVEERVVKTCTIKIKGDIGTQNCITCLSKTFPIVNKQTAINRHINDLLSM